MNTIHTNSAVSVVIEVIHQFIQNKKNSPYVISQFSHMHIHTHIHIRPSETLSILMFRAVFRSGCGARNGYHVAQILKT